MERATRETKREKNEQNDVEFCTPDPYTTIQYCTVLPRTSGHRYIFDNSLVVLLHLITRQGMSSERQEESASMSGVPASEPIPKGGGDDSSNQQQQQSSSLVPVSTVNHHSLYAPAPDSAGSAPEATSTREVNMVLNENDLDKLAEDLVLVEGDGNVHRPKLLKLKRAPSNNSNAAGNAKAITAAVAMTTTTTNLSKLSSHAKRLGIPTELSPALAVRKSGVEDFFQRIRRTSSLGGIAVNESDSDFDSHYITIHDPGSPPKDQKNVSGSSKKNKNDNKSKRSSTSNNAGVALTSEDIEICRRLDEEYERALEEREIGYNARYASVRQSTLVSVLFLLVYMIQGTLVYMNQTEWSIPEALFFSIFTITTVGYGKEDLPTTPEFQAYTIFYIMIGIAALTIMVSG